jgi:hypothetical protein
MADLITVIVAGVEVIFAGSEMTLQFLVDTEILGATLYGWFLGYILIQTIIGIFFYAKTTPEEVKDELA